MKVSPWFLFTLAQALYKVSGQTLTLEVVQKTSYPFPTPTNVQDFDIVGTGSDGATTLVNRIRVSEYLVIDDSRSTPFISTDTKTATFTQTFVADGPSAYQIIYSPEQTGAVGLIQSCTFDGEERGNCVERDWVIGQSSTLTTMFTGPIVPYQTVTQLAKSETTGSDSSNTDNSNNVAHSNDISLWMAGVAAVFCFLTLF
ncbi:hypothetical protein Moror_15952 [Moniliophthora roreri MCA 2997]|uniref:Uncharacterized protein n=2 Tax=Moniliophthora roreri TaxID=221103 RepID=V2YM58_MONRO|nr:hypothetical protein Moror_15952 [Moniliophthora roreri MCA 2997]